jgi:hypothetical protein
MGRNDKADVDVIVSGSGAVQIGNTDIGTPEWSPPEGEPERPTLPGCEHEPNLPRTERRAVGYGWHRHRRALTQVAAAWGLFAVLLIARGAA